MNEDDPARGEGDGGTPPGSFTQDIHHSPIGARVPEDTGRGVFCNATMILQSNEEIVIDFLSTLNQPQQVVARVILTPSTFAQVIGALRENLNHYEERFGRLNSRELPQHPLNQPGASSSPVGPAVPAHDPGAPSAVSSPVAQGGSGAIPGQHEHQAPRATAQTPPPRIEDLYEQLKLPERVLGGTYANMVLIRHMAEEFSFDFIANFYPRPVVVCRVFFAAGRIPLLLDAMSNSLHIFRKKAGGQSPPAAPDSPGGPGSSGGPESPGIP
jgi:hypothetical protein